jgi:hypothetical protein
LAEIMLDEPGKPAAFSFRKQNIVLQMDAVGISKAVKFLHNWMTSYPINLNSQFSKVKQTL